jgi:hypothetical protein
MRKVPLDELFMSFPAQIRKTAKECNKQIKFSSQDGYKLIYNKMKIVLNEPLNKIFEWIIQYLVGDESSILLKANVDTTYLNLTICVAGEINNEYEQGNIKELFAELGGVVSIEKMEYDHMNFNIKIPMDKKIPEW